MENIESLLQAGLIAHRAGDLDKARGFYMRVLAIAPAQADAHHLLGMVALQRQDFVAAIGSLQNAVAFSPGTAMFHFNLGKAMYAHGEMAKAAAALGQAAALDGRLIDAQVMLANARIVLGEYGAGAEAAGAALRGRAGHVPALVALGTARRFAGEIEAARAAFSEATRMAPEVFEGWMGLGYVGRTEKNWGAALEALERAAQLAPGRFEPALERGEILAKVGRLQEAIVELRRAVVLQPGHAAAYVALGSALHDAGQLEQSRAAFERARDLDPALAEAHYNLGVVAAAVGSQQAAIGHYQRALAVRPEYAAALVNLAELLRVTARVSEAIVVGRRAVELAPENSLIHSALLYAMHFADETTAESLLAEHRRWAQRHILPLMEKSVPHENGREERRRLRVGYVSPDFREHPVGRYILPVLENHDKEAFEVFLYSGVARPDGLTVRCRAAADHYVETGAGGAGGGGVMDETLVEMIRRDRIDVLVDLSLHMAGNRMRVFGLRPAPVAVSGFGYPSTTGNPAIDVRLSDRFLDPAEAALCGPENIARLPGSFWCFRPYDDVEEVRPLPVLSQGRITFGSLNNPAKTTAAGIALWTEALRAVPGSRLVLLSATPGDGELLARFAAVGIDAGRLAFLPKAGRAEYLRYYRLVDVVLDPYPYHGHSTSCDALWMGVPVMALTMGGRSGAEGLPVSRAGASILHAVGLGELVVSERSRWEGMVAGLALDVERLRGISMNLRERMRMSALMDAGGYTRAVEEIYRAAFTEWCRR